MTFLSVLGALALVYLLVGVATVLFFVVKEIRRAAWARKRYAQFPQQRAWEEAWSPTQADWIGILQSSWMIIPGWPLFWLLETVYGG